MYFATEPVQRIGAELMRRIENWDEHLVTSGKAALWRRSYNAYYVQAREGGQIRRVGEQNEFHSIKVNHYRSFIQNIKNILAENRLSFDAKAINSDTASQAQAILGTSLVEVYMRQGGVEQYIKQALEDSLKFGEGFVSSRWETEAGEVYAVTEAGVEIREGDVAYANHLPADVIRDFVKDSPRNHNWYILRTRRNRYDLAAKFSELEDKILNISGAGDLRSGGDYESEDEVFHYTFYHAKTPSLPDGRIVEFLDSDTILLDGPLPYSEIPVYRLSPGDQSKSIFGYSVAYDLLPICEAMDSLYSVLLSNNMAFGTQSILSPRGGNISHTELSSGLALIEFDSKVGPPTPLQLTASAPETYRFAEILERLCQTISGIQGVTRGNSQELSLSGSAYALLQSLSVQSANDLEQSYVKLSEDVATGLVYTLQTYASTPRMSLIAGIANRSYMREWKGSDLAGVKRIVVDSGNAMGKTIAGRVQLAETLMSNGLVSDPATFLSVLNTGRLEPAIEQSQSEVLLIRSENEALAEGRIVTAALVDTHLQHINHHRAVLNSVEAREDPEIVANTLAHIQQHLDILMNPANATMLAVLGQSPVPPASAASSGPSVIPPEVALPNLPNMPSPPPNADPASAEIIKGNRNGI